MRVSALRSWPANGIFGFEADYTSESNLPRPAYRLSRVRRRTWHRAPPPSPHRVAAACGIMPISITVSLYCQLAIRGRCISARWRGPVHVPRFSTHRRRRRIGMEVNGLRSTKLADRLGAGMIRRVAAERSSASPARSVQQTSVGCHTVPERATEWDHSTRSTSRRRGVFQ